MERDLSSVGQNDCMPRISTAIEPGDDIVLGRLHIYEATFTFVSPL